MITNERGASIIGVILVLAVLTLSGVIFVSVFSTGVEESTGEVLSSRALFAAEGGMEAAIGHLKKAPVATNWLWKDGYLAKPMGGGTVDAEVLEYESRDATLAGANKCEPFESVIVSTGANPARTVYASLAWSSASNMGLELYDNSVADCNNPTASANLIASSATSNMPETIRYRVQTAPPATITYTARVLGVAGDAYKLRIAHPDETNFGTGNTCGQPAGPPYDACMRAVISLGRHMDARREVFSGFSRTP
ncbi:MAG: hypothetical protein HYV24_12370 [Deltaproteobacteria bacterium]|nr:hypothetical protein [Deltaproteobacteria bacterium]